MYYRDKAAILKDLFASEAVTVDCDTLRVNGLTYPIVDDVIVILDPSEYPAALSQKLVSSQKITPANPGCSTSDIQFSFGDEWTRFSQILPEHEKEFYEYFDLIDISRLKNGRVCDLGCGNGRWSYYLSDKCREIILVDFSEAIFVARCNLRHQPNVLFFMGDVTRLPFRDDFADLLLCIGVLHHLPQSALDAVRSLRRYAPRMLVYLYYALDNKPTYFRILLTAVSLLRRRLSGVYNPTFRAVFTSLVTRCVYLPLIGLGSLLRPLELGSYVPLYEAYTGKSIERIRQDVYDRFFTGIEQRYRREEILELAPTFSRMTISDRMPYWHFLCER